MPLVAVGLLIFAVAHALLIQRSEPTTLPPVPPPTSPFGDTVAGAGMVEPSTEASGTSNIAVGSQNRDAVTKVWVSVGQSVEAGDLLFELDDRQAVADLKARQAALMIAKQQLRRLNLQPRPEEVPVSEAQVAVAEANLRQAQDQYERARRLVGSGVVSQQEFVTSEQNYQSTRAQLALARSSLALLKAGAWAPDRTIAAATVARARTQVEQAKTTLDLLRVRAPVDGTILQVNVRPGEYVSTSSGQSLILMGGTSSPSTSV